MTDDSIDLRATLRNETSQHGENGVIAAIFAHIGTTTRRCVEFGAYSLSDDSNVYPLWQAAGWDALLIEGDPGRATAIREAYERLRHSSTPPAGTATIVEQFIAPEGSGSLDALLDRLGWTEEIDLCVIDIDGLDYQVFEGLRRSPRVVVCEFNASIPPHLAIVGAADGNYLGASARALHELGMRKGYSLVACTHMNCIFVRRDLAAGFLESDNLDALFDPSGITYLMSAYDGSVFLSRPPLFASNLFSRRAERDLGADAARFWIPRSELSGRYLFSRTLFEMVQRFAPQLGARSLNWVRSLRRRTGRTFLPPPS